MTNKQNKIIIGSRKSLLAMTQAKTVLKELKGFFPEYDFRIKKIVTSGDRLKSWPKSQAKGLFVKEIEEALLREEIDIAVHSMKDLPVEIPAGLEIAAVTRRVDARDVLISRSGKGLSDLPAGSVIGTSSPRRKSQIRALRKRYKVVDIRGNLDTRLKKLKDGSFDAIVIAAAGILRLGWDKKITEYINEDIVLPAPGQGVLGIQIRRKDKKIKSVVRKLDHRFSRLEAQAEREFLECMGGGCRVPIGAFARIKEGYMTVQGIVSYSLKKTVKAEVKVSLGKAGLAGAMLAEKIKKILKTDNK